MPAPITKVCRGCRQAFTIPPGEQEWMISRGFDLPVRCKFCRQARRQARKVDQAPAHYDANRAQPPFRTW